MYATHLVCKGCGSQHPLDARFACDRCFGPLEAAYDHAAIARASLATRSTAGPATLWRYADSCRCAARRGLPVGNSPLIRADRLAAELGLACELCVKTETSNPTHSFKDRVVAVAARQGARARLRGGGLRLHRQPRRLGRRRTPRRTACRPTSSCRPTSRGRRSSPPPSTARPVRGGRQLRRRQPALHGARPASARGRSSTSTCGPTTARARRRWPTRWPSSSAGGLPDRCVAPIASGSLYTKILQRLPGAAGGRPAGRGAGADMHGAQGARLRAGGGGLRGRRRLRGAGPARHGSPSRWRSATRPTASTRWTLPAAPAAHRGRTEEEIVEGIQLLARTTGIFTETAGGVTTAVLAKLAARGRHRPGGEGGALHHRRRPEDARRGRAVRGDDPVSPDPDDVDAALERRLASA